QDRRGVHLLAARTARAPHAEPARRRVRLRQRGEDLLGQQAQLLLVPEEVGLSAGEQIERGGKLRLRLCPELQQARVVAVGRQVVQRQARRQPALKQSQPRVIEAEPCRRVEDA